MKHFPLFILVGCLYAHPLVAQTTTADTIRLTLLADTIALDEVVVTERRTPAATGRWSDMSPVELVTVAGSNGDLYKALQTLPGVQVQGETGRLLVREDNVYVNATLRRRMKDGWEGYAGAAFSYNRQGIRGAAQTDDCWEERQQELHVKATATRLWTFGLRIGGGVESFIRRYANRYAWQEVESAGKVRPVVSAAFLSAMWFPW